MSEFERLGDALPEIGRRTHKKELRGRIVEGSASYVASDGRQTDEQLEKTSDAPIPFPCSSQSTSSPSSSVCPKCKGAGWLRKNVPYGHPDFGKDFPCICKIREQRERRQHKMIALSERFGFQRSWALSTFRRQVKGVQVAYQATATLIEHLEAWAKQRETTVLVKNEPPQEWLVLLGPPGIGKTHLAMAVTNACIDAGIVALFATVPDLLDYLRSTYEPTATMMYDDVFIQLRNAEVLVLDDLGAQHNSSWADEKIFQLINHRYNSGRPTVITLNKKAWAYLDERIRSRLQDARLVLLIDIADAQDYRKHQGKNVVRHHARGTERSVHSDIVMRQRD